MLYTDDRKLVTLQYMLMKILNFLQTNHRCNSITERQIYIIRAPKHNLCFYTVDI